MKPEQVALYIAEMSRELNGLAERTGLPFLAYLLGMVQQEAQALARPKGAPADPQEPEPGA